MEDTNEEYQKFVDKFKAKKTTDDCYTPDNIYETVLNWVTKEYKVNREKSCPAVLAGRRLPEV